MWIGYYGAQHSHSDALSSAIVKRSVGVARKDSHQHGDVTIRVEGGVVLPRPKVVPVSETETPARKKSPL